MPHHPRPRRVAPIGARVPLAHAVTDVVDVSGTGVLIRVSDEWRPGSEWSWAGQDSTGEPRRLCQVFESSQMPCVMLCMTP